MRTSLLEKRFIRFGLLAIVAAVSYWVCSVPVATSEIGVPAEDRPPMYVLQVGIGKYVNAPVWAELRGAVKDVVEMRKVLESDRWGVPPENIVTLTDAQGTKPQIFEKFRSHLIANAQKHHAKVKDPSKGAVVMFQFSGHGSQAPDNDGDEKDDGKDETLVTYDSQDAPGKNFDITDDEIYALTRELRQWTDNIVYVLDSCHSGSGTRDSDDVRRLPERKNLPVPVAGVGVAATRSGEKKKEDGDSGVLPPGDAYIVITAARPNELASQKNCFEECGETTRPVVYGNLTYYLIDELRNARADTSYRELMENVTRRVTAEKPTQTPQLEGDGARFVFGSLGRKEDRYVRVLEGETKRPNGGIQVKIAAGAMQGVGSDFVVAFYDKAVTRFDQAEPIATGSVTAVTPSESTVLIANSKRAVTTGDKSVIVSPGLDSLKLKVNLDADTAKLSADQKNTITAIRGSLRGQSNEDLTSREILVVTPEAAKAGRWDVAVLKDKYSIVAPRIGTAVECEGETDKTGDVFYIAGKDFVPLYGFCLSADLADERAQLDAASSLERALVHLARLRSANAIANPRSMLNGKVVVRVMKLSQPFRCENGRLNAGAIEALVPGPIDKVHKIHSRDIIWLEITNNSPKDLYLALLNMPPDGSVKLFSPRPIFEEQDSGVNIPAGGKRILMGDDCRLNSDGDISGAGAFIMSGEVGMVERFKLIASTEVIRRSELEYLEMPALVNRKGTSMLGSKKDWTTVETIFKFADTGK